MFSQVPLQLCIEKKNNDFLQQWSESNAVNISINLLSICLKNVQLQTTHFIFIL